MLASELIQSLRAFTKTFGDLPMKSAHYEVPGTSPPSVKSVTNIDVVFTGIDTPTCYVLENYFETKGN